jgi:hypothetical protein
LGQLWSRYLRFRNEANDTRERRKRLVMKKGYKGIVLGLFISLYLGAVRETFAIMRLHSTFGEVIMENLRLGETYNTREMVNLPLMVTNYSDEKITVFLTVLKPQPDQLRKGYEPIPDTDWIELSTDRMEIQPGGHGAADVIIHVPSDEQYARRRYQVLINSTASGKGNISLGLFHKLLFSIAPSEAQAKQDERKEKLLANLNYTVLPPKIMVYDFKLGKKQNLVELTGNLFKIINPNDQDYRYRVTSMAIGDSKVTSSPGYEDCPDPSFLTFSESEVDIPANTVKVIKVFLNIPDKKAYRGKKYMFLIRTELLGQEISVDQYNRVFVTTEK